MRKLILAAAITVMTSGCNFWYNEVPSPDDLMHAVPWFDHMILSKAVHPYQVGDYPRTTPAGSVPLGGAEPDWGTGDPMARPAPRYGFDAAYANALVRPTDLPAVKQGRGQELYETYCAVCHGPTGMANGTVQMGAVPLVGARTDGLYIRYGGPLMPQYGDKITRIEDRWAVVDYVRSLGAGRQQ
ncbi:MAG TPA: cytochrome c [Gemmatimonadales bacterium]|nr:cytochrome c [Gemmatimonadales bacterium]